LLIHGKNNYPAQSVKIALQPVKSQGKVRDFFVVVGGNPAMVTVDNKHIFILLLFFIVMS